MDITDSLYVCMVNIKLKYNFVKTPGVFIISTDENPSFPIESFAFEFKKISYIYYYILCA